MFLSRSAVLAALTLFGCGGTSTPPDGGLPPSCPTHANPTYELGTGARAFEPIVDGQDLVFTPGSQGGCHFWLAARTDGFPRRGTKLRYEVFFADTGTTTMSFSSSSIPLEPVDGDADRCEAFGVTGFLIRPWTFIDRRVEIRTRVWYEPNSGQQIEAMDSKTVVARWPNDDPLACGVRN